MGLGDPRGMLTGHLEDLIDDASIRRFSHLALQR